MSKQDLLKTQTCILKVNIDCDGCNRKVRKILQKIDGVYAVAIDMQQGKVTVTGDVEPDLLIKKLEKSSKHAEVWSSGNGENKSKDGELDNVNEQLKKLLQMGGGKGGGNEVMKAKGGKDQQKGGVIAGGGDGKNVQQVNFQQLLEQMRSGSKDFTVKDQKPVKADLPSEGGGGDDDFGDFSGDEFDDDEFDDDGEFDDDDEFDEDDEFDDDDEFDEDEDNYDDDEDEGDQHHKQQKAEKGGGGEKAEKGGGGGGGEKAKKGGGGGGGGIMSMVGKVIGGNNDGKKVDGPKNEGEGKNGNEGKKGGGPKNGGEGKNGNKSGGGGGGGGGFQDLDIANHTKGGGGGGGGEVGPVGQYQVGPMGQQFLAAPVMNGGGGYYQGMGPMGPVPGNPYQQQQYMAMMNQQRMMHGGGAAYHPAMYGRPPPGYGYATPPAYQDHITHMFSDENPGSCSIM